MVSAMAHYFVDAGGSEIHERVAQLFIDIYTLVPYLGNNPSHEELEKLMPWHPKVKNGDHIRKSK